MANEVTVGSVWDDGRAGDHWEVVELLPNDRVRVRCVKTWGSRKITGETFVWSAGSLTDTDARQIN